MKDQVRHEAKAGKLWSIWVRQGILTQDRGRGESPLRPWHRHDSKEKLRRRRIDVMRAEIGSPRDQRREQRIAEISRSLLR